MIINFKKQVTYQLLIIYIYHSQILKNIYFKRKDTMSKYSQGNSGNGDSDGGDYQNNNSSSSCNNQNGNSILNIQQTEKI